MQDMTFDISSRLKCFIGVMNFIHLTHDFDGAVLPVLPVRLILLKTINIQLGHIDIGLAFNNPMSQKAADPAPLQNPQGIQTRGHIKILEFGGFTHQTPRAKNGNLSFRLR